MVVIDENGKKKYVYDRSKYDRSKEYAREKETFKKYTLRLDRKTAEKLNKKLKKNKDTFTQLAREMIEKYLRDE